MKTINRKAQMQMTETIAVLFIFFILIAFGMIFYYTYQQSAMKEEQVKNVENRLEKVTSKVLNMPELMCTRGTAEPIGDCIDLIKLGQAKELFAAHFDDYYFNLFSYAKITITELYPGNSSRVVYNMKVNPNENKTLSYESARFVISLRNQTAVPGETHFGMGVLEVGVYYEQIE